MAQLPKKIQLDIVTPETSLFSGEVDEVYVPGVRGQMGILPGHAPLLSELGIGEVSYKVDGRQERLFCSWGFVEVLPGRVAVLAEVAERAAEIDVERASKARDRAEQRLRSTNPDTDFDRARIALGRAMSRLQIAGR
ncbi:MAG: F0F1 ATP synthase subunit epsilon [Acidobacteriota bacterium]